MIVGKWGPWTALRGARVRWYFVWRQLARDSPDSREYGRYHLLLTSRLLLMTALASLSPLLSSDWSTLRLARLSLVDIGGGSEAGVVFIRCVDTWHIYRFSSPHYHSFLRALSWHNATLLLTLISIVFMSPDPPPESDSILQKLRPPDLARNPDCSRRHETGGDVSQTMSCRHCSTDCSTS